jgi:hypothetical protein
MRPRKLYYNKREEKHSDFGYTVLLEPTIRIEGQVDDLMALFQS